MSVLDFISGEIETTGLRSPRQWLIDWVRGGEATASGQAVNGDTAVTLPAYLAAVRCIAEDVAALPRFLYRRMQPRGREKITDDRRHWLFHSEPNPDTSAMAFWETMIAWAMNWGGGYAEIEFNGAGDVLGLHQIHPSRVAMQRDARGVRFEVHLDDGRTVSIPNEKMFHLHGLGPNGLEGWSLVKLGAESIGVGLAAQSFGAAFFGSGTSLSGVLEYPGEIDDTDRVDEIRRQWRETYIGPENRHKVAILEDGMKYQALGIPPEAAQFIETRRFQVTDMARLVRVPPHKIADLGDATFSNVENENRQYADDSLAPWVERINQESNRKLLKQDEQPIYFFDHVFKGRLRGDSAARGAFYHQMFQIGVYSSNDIRELENENPRPGGDAYYTPLNMASSDDPDDGAADDGAADGPVGADPGTSAGESMRERFRPVVAEAVRRIVRKESIAATRASKKSGANGEAFSAWVDRFYAGLEDEIVEAVSVPAATLAGIISPGLVDPAEAVATLVRAYATGHVAISRTEIVDAFARGVLEDRLATWAGARVDAAAGLIVSNVAGVAAASSRAKHDNENHRRSA